MKTIVCCLAMLLLSSVSAEDAIKIDVKEMKEQATLVIKAEKVKPAEIGAWLAKVLPKIGAHLEKLKVKPEGAPFTKYIKMNDDSFDLEAGFVVPAGTKGEGDIVESKLPGGSIAVTTHVGPYMKLGDTWTKLRQWLADNKKEMGDGSWESYVDDPTQVKEAELKTVIYMALKK